MTAINSNSIKIGSKIDKMDKPLSPLFIIFVMAYGGAFIAFFLFFFAKDWLWIEGWILWGAFETYFFFMMVGLNKRNPRILRNRMKIKKEKKMEKQESKKASSSDKIIMPLFAISFMLSFVISDLDHPYNWPGDFPFWLEIIGFIILGLGLYLIYLTMLQNAYGAKVLDIREGQRLIDTGVYAHVRHPMYAGFIGMALGIPLGLGSWWAIIPAIGSVLLMVVRIKYEEEMLITGLEGYKEYRERVKYKLIPKIY